jgi:hypothetical protein
VWPPVICVTVEGDRAAHRASGVRDRAAGSRSMTRAEGGDT